MQTRSLAAASGAFFALALLAFRPALARPEAPPPAPDQRNGNSAVAPSPFPRWQAEPVVRSAPADRPSPEIRAERALTLADGPARTAALAESLAAWAAVDAGAALVWLERHSEQDKPLLTQSIGEGLAADPAAATFAMTFLAQDHEAGALLAGALVQALAAQGDAAAAARLARATPEGWSHEWATVAFTNLAYEDTATALESLATINDPALRRTTAAAIVAGWSERDPAARADAVATVASELNRSFPAAAAAARPLGRLATARY